MTAPSRRKLHLFQGLFAGALLIGIALVVLGYRNRSREFDESNQRARMISQMLGALVTYATEHESDTAQYPAFLSNRFGDAEMKRYAWITLRADPASSDIVLIERPEWVDGEWCFAAFGDAHVKKIRREDAARIIKETTPSLTAPAASP